MMRDTYNGRRLTVKTERKTGRTGSYINGVLLGFAYGTSPETQARELMALRSWVDMADERRATEPDAYPAHFYMGATA